MIGNQNVSPTPDIIIPDNIQSGPDGIVLYQSKMAAFPRGTILSTDNIVDALVYGTDSSVDSSMLSRLAPGQFMAEMTSDMTLSRCVQGQTMTMSAFSASTQTPGWCDILVSNYEYWLEKVIKLLSIFSWIQKTVIFLNDVTVNDGKRKETMRIPSTSSEEFTKHLT